MREFAEAFKVTNRGSEAIYNGLAKGFVALFSGADAIAFALIRLFAKWAGS